MRLIALEKPTMSVDSEKLAAAVFLKEPIWNPRHMLVIEVGPLFNSVSLILVKR